ncbi:MAG: electron transfer flavoprotein subunit alpha/FixB family protein, partial [Proteobacteria bacterium]|nr:electron transfer flavoprotein subunit alpha/FixB family protein [Pseudomonadota bacterium]
MKALVVAEHGPDRLADATRRAVTAARSVADLVDVLVAGGDCHAAANAAANIAGVTGVLVAEGASVARGLAEPIAELVATLAPGYDAVVAPATTFGKNVLPRAAAKLDTPLISDVLEIVALRTYRRAMNSGNAVATVESDARPQLLTVRPAAFAPASAASVAAPIAAVDAPAHWTRTRLV